MNTVVIGSKGLIGNALYLEYKKRNLQVIGTHHSPPFPILKLEKPSLQDMKWDLRNFHFALIAAGVSRPRQCFFQKEYSYQCNVLGTVQLIRGFLELGIKPIIFSTDNVFDGEVGNYSEESPTNPINDYGHQKATLERIVEENFKDRCLLLRLSKVYTLIPSDSSLLSEMSSLFFSGKKVRAAHDQIFCPILIDDLIKVIFHLQECGASGIFNLCGSETWSRLKIAQFLANALKMNELQIEPISLDSLSEPFKRPKCLSMLNHKVLKITGLELTSLSDNIRKFAHLQKAV